MSGRLGLLIVGGGPAGMAAARAFRERNGTSPVAIVADEHRMPYNRPPLTKELLRGEAAESELPLEAEDWLVGSRVDLISGRVVALDPAGRVAELSGGRVLEYDKCLLATGAEPARLPVPGADHPRVRVVRTLDDVRELIVRLGTSARVAVIGAGFIGCEIAASLRTRGHSVELVSDEPAPNAGRLGDEAAAIIAGWLEESGVRLHFGVSVDRIEAAGPAAVVVAGDVRVSAEVVVMAVGAVPRTELAVQAGVELESAGVPVDAGMRTILPGLLAAGDLAFAANLAAGRRLRVEHWGDALEQGEIAGTVAAGEAAAWDTVPGFWSTIGERTLKYAAWGDGYDDVRLERHPDGGFTARYTADGVLVGVLAHNADADYERGQDQIAAPASPDP